MNKLIIPCLIFILQILGYLFLYFISKSGHVDVPIAWVLFNFLSIFNFIILIPSYIFYFRIENKANFWLFPISIASITIIILIIQYIRMFMGKL